MQCTYVFCCCSSYWSEKLRCFFRLWNESLQFKDFHSLLSHIQTITKSYWHYLQSISRDPNYFLLRPRVPLGSKPLLPLPGLLQLPPAEFLCFLSRFKQLLEWSCTNVSYIMSLLSSKSYQWLHVIQSTCHNSDRDLNCPAHAALPHCFPDTPSPCSLRSIYFPPAHCWPRFPG